MVFVACGMHALQPNALLSALVLCQAVSRPVVHCTAVLLHCAIYATDRGAGNVVGGWLSVCE